MKQFYVYILTNRHNAVLYVGVTNNLARRIWEHRQKLTPGFTSKYKVTKLIYYEEYPHAYDAIQREKQLKRWHRDWKWNLIKSSNPELKDLNEYF